MPTPLSRPLAAAVLDLDGTLVDTLADISAAVNEMLRELGLPAARNEAVAGFIGKGTEHLLHKTLEHVGAPAVLYPRAWDAYHDAYRALNGRWSAVYPGVVEGLEALRRAGLRLACLTNKPGEFARDLLAAKALAPYFELVFGGDAFERKKPDPLPILKTCEALGVAPAHTLMVGDSSNDARAARAAGCPVLLVSYGYNHGEPVDAVDADGVIERLDRIVLNGSC
jgi:phosphoglycolate phosphatase